MSSLRVLVVEDSLTVRKRLVEILTAAPGIEVVGEAEDGKRAIEQVLALRPDAISMDMMLPVMTGLAVTEYVMAHRPTPILIVSSSHNRGELFKTYEALAAGALDAMEKPLGDDADEDWAARYIAALKLIARVKVITHPRARLSGGGGAERAPRQPPAVSWASADVRAREVVAIGASTGGPGAILEVLQALPEGFPLPVLVVLHIGEPFSSALAEWLDSQSPHRVSFAQDGQRVHGPGVILAPANRHLAVRNGRLRLSEEPERHSCRPSVDVLFESLAREYGRAVIACLLTGMGRDGAAGLLEIRNAGGLTFAQDEASCVVYGMPREAFLIGAAEHVLPLKDIGPALARTLWRAGAESVMGEEP